MRYLFSLLIVPFLFQGCSCDSSDPLPLVDAAERGLEEIQEIGTESGYLALGFPNDVQVTHDTLAPPFKVFVVPLDELQNAPIPVAASSLLIDIDRYMYPVTDGVATHTFVVLEGRGQGYVTVSYGGANAARTYTSARASMKSQAPFQGIDTFSLVAIPALNLTFVGATPQGGSLQIKPTATALLRYGSVGDSIALDTGQVYAADALFTQLRPYAKEHDGGIR